MLALSLKSPPTVKWNGLPGWRLPESPTVLTFAPPPPSVCGGGNGDGGCAVADWLTPQMGCDNGV